MEAHRLKKRCLYRIKIDVRTKVSWDDISASLKVVVPRELDRVPA